MSRAASTPKALHDPEHVALSVLALVNEPMSRSALSKACRRLDVTVPDERGRRKAVSPTNLAPLLEQWRQEGKVVQVDQGWLTTPRGQYQTLVAAQAAGTLRALAALACSLGFWIDDEEIRARAALFAEDHERVLAYTCTSKRRKVDVRCLMGLVPPVSDPAVVGLLPELLRVPFLVETLRWHITIVEPVDEELRDAVRAHGDGAARALLAMQDLLLLDSPTIDDDPHSWTEEARALEALRDGDAPAARAAIHRAWASSSSRAGVRKPRLDSPIAPLLTLALASGGDEDRALARAQLTSPAATGRDASSAYTFIADFLDVQTGRIVVSPDWLGLLVAGTVTIWTEKRHLWPPQLIHRTVRVAADAAASTGTWPSRQLASMLRAFGQPTTLADAAPHPLHEIYTPPADWERALQMIEAALPATAEPSRDAARKERLAWHVRVIPPRDSDDPASAGRLFAEARLQKRRAAGWSKGRVVALRRLVGDDKNAPWMTEHDRRVCRHVQVQRHWYGSDEWALKPGFAVDLVDHPDVVLAEDPTHTVAVVDGVVGLYLTRQADRIDVELRPAAIARSAVHVAQPTPTRIEVFRRPELPEALLVELARGLRLPTDAEPRLQALLGRLAPLLPVHTDLDLDDANIETQPADARCVVELRRHLDGLRIALAVTPLGPGGPRLLPGRGAPRVVDTIDGAPVRADRDLEAEQENLHLLLERAPIVAAHPPLEAPLSLPFVDDCLAVLDQVRDLPESVVRVVWEAGQPLSVAGDADSSRLRLSLATADSWFEASGEVTVDEDLVVGLQALLEALPRRRGRFVPLDESRYVALADELLGRLQTIEAAAALSDAPEALHLHPLAAGLVAGWADDVAELKADDAVTERLARVQAAATLPATLPSTLDADLRDYQQEGVTWMRRLAHWGAGAILADDMGLGKTVQALAVLLDRAAEGPALVIAPTSVCAGWLEQATRFAPTLQTRFVSGAQAGLPQETLEPFDVLVCSYTVATLLADDLADIAFASVVLDEAQAIKNPATQRAKAVFRLRGEFRLATTGTPIENNLLELWSIMRFCNPGFLGSRKTFEKRFVKPIQTQEDPEALARLRRLVSPFMLRRLKRDVLTELPARTEVVHHVEPSDAERAFSEALRRSAVERLSSTDATNGQGAIQILAELTRLRQAACDPSLVDPDTTIGSSKLDAFMELAQELVDGGHRVLVFSQFVQFLTRARARLDRAGLAYQYLDGSTPAGQRKASVQAFQGGEGDLFLISLRAGGTGLNLTAADYVVHLDPWWNPAVEDQASDRAHRIGQTRPVTVYRLVTQGTIEERVLELHGAKRRLADHLLDDQAQAQTLDADALMALLEAG